MRCPTSIRLSHSVDDAWRDEDATLLLNDIPAVDTAKSTSAMLYLLGYKRPRFPVPATMDTAVLSVLHQDAGAWAVPWVKHRLRKRI